MQTKTDLLTKKCAPCEGGVPKLASDQAMELLSQLESWELNKDATAISKKFNFKGFNKTIAFVNAAAWIAQQESHHPEMIVGYNYCTISYQTHAIDGLSENDFICAAKIDALFA